MWDGYFTLNPRIAPIVQKRPLYMFFYCGAAYFCINVLSGLVLYFFDDLRESGQLYTTYTVTRNGFNISQFPTRKLYRKLCAYCILYHTDYVASCLKFWARFDSRRKRRIIGLKIFSWAGLIWLKNFPLPGRRFQMPRCHFQLPVRKKKQIRWISGPADQIDPLFCCQTLNYIILLNCEPSFSIFS